MGNNAAAQLKDLPSILLKKPGETSSNTQKLQSAYELYVQGLSLANESNFTNAIAAFTEAITCLDSVPLAKNFDFAQLFSKLYANRAGVYYSIQDYDSSINDCNEALRLWPQNPDAFFFRSNSHYESHAFGDALNDICMFLKYCSAAERTGAYIAKATCLLQLGRGEEAQEACHDVLQLDDSNVAALAILSKCSDDEHELHITSKLLSMQPMNAQLYFDRACVYMRQHDYKQAIADAKRGLQIINNEEQEEPYSLNLHVYLLLLLAEALVRSNQQQDAIDTMKLLMELFQKYSKYPTMNMQILLERLFQLEFSYEEQGYMNENVSTSIQAISKRVQIIKRASAEFQSITPPKKPPSKPMEYADLVIEEEIRSDEVGTVFKGYFKGFQASIKKLKPNMADRLKAVLDKENELLSNMKHFNLVLMYGSCVSPSNELCVVTELMDKGSLYQLLHVQHTKLPLLNILQLALDIAKGCQYLHHFPIVHRDLKSSCILLKSEEKRLVAKVADFAAAKILTLLSMNEKSFYGSPLDWKKSNWKGRIPWLPPEILTSTFHPGEPTTDVYSFGMILYELVSGSIPFSEHKYMQMLMQGKIDALVQLIVEKGARPEIPATCPKELKRLIERCWKGIADERPSMDAICEILQALLVQHQEEMEYLADHTTLHYACVNSHVRTIRNLIKNGINVNIQIGPKQLTALHMTCKLNDSPTLFLLLQANPDLNIVNIFGETALFTAAQNGHVAIVKALVNAGADITICDSQERSPLFIAASNGHFEVCNYLVEMGASVTQSDVTGTTPIMVGAPYMNILNLFMTKNAPFTDQNDDGGYALYFAAQHGNLEGAKLLIEKGAQEYNDFSLLHGACESGNEELVQYCLQTLQCSVNVTDYYDQTPLFLAAACCDKSTCEHFACCKALLESKANVNHKSKTTGITPLYYARTNLGIAKLFIEHGAIVEQTYVESAPSTFTYFVRSHCCYFESLILEQNEHDRIELQQVYIKNLSHLEAMIAQLLRLPSNAFVVQMQNKLEQEKLERWKSLPTNLHILIVHCMK